MRVMMNRRCKVHLLWVGLLAFSLLLSGCTFLVRMPNGRIAQVTLPDQEVQRFLSRMDALTLRLLEETQRLGDEGLRQVVIEVRQAYFRLMRQIGSHERVPANPMELQLKLQAFEIQMMRRLDTPHQEARYQSLRIQFDQLKQEVQRFSSMVEQAAR
jgi:hypothetical protein